MITLSQPHGLRFDRYQNPATASLKAAKLGKLGQCPAFGGVREKLEFVGTVSLGMAR
jgi:hypothetical protein